MISRNKREDFKWTTPEQFAEGTGYPGYIPLNARDAELVKFSSDPLPINKEYQMQHEYFPSDNDYRPGMRALFGDKIVIDPVYNRKNMEMLYKALGVSHP